MSHANLNFGVLTGDVNSLYLYTCIRHACTGWYSCKSDHVGMYSVKGEKTTFFINIEIILFEFHTSFSKYRYISNLQSTVTVMIISNKYVVRI